MTSGMIHLGDQLGLYRALAAADGAADDDRARRGDRARRALGARVGLQPGCRQARHASRRRRHERFSVTPGGGRRAGVAGPRGVRHGHVPPPARRRCRRSSDLPESFRTGRRRRLRQPRAGGRGRHRAQLRAVEPGPPAARRRAGDGRHRGQAAGRCRASPTSAAAPAARCSCWPARSRRARSPATTSPSTPWRAPVRASPSAGLTNATFHDPRAEPLPADGSLDLVTTFDCIHDMTDPQCGDARHPGRARATTARGCSSTSRPSTRSSRTSPRTRWPR